MMRDRACNITIKFVGCGLQAEVRQKMLRLSAGILVHCSSNAARDQVGDCLIDHVSTVSHH